MDNDIRQMLRERADDVSTTLPAISPRTVQRAKRRRVLTGGGALAALVVFAVAGFAIAGALRGQPVQPVGPQPKVGATFRIGADATDLAYGFGSLWYSTDRSLLRVDPSSGKVLATIDSFPHGLALGSNPDQPNRIAIGAGSVWILVQDDGVLRSSATPTTTQTTLPDGTHVSQFSVGAGSIRVAGPKSGFRYRWALAQVDPRGMRVRSSSIQFDTLPSAITVDGGDVWVVGRSWATSKDRGYLFRFGSKTLSLVSKFGTDGFPDHVVAENGTVWFSRPGSNGRIFRFDPERGRVVAAITDPNAGDLALTQLSLWVDSFGTSAVEVDQFDKPTLGPESHIILGKKPEFANEFALGGRMLWFVDASDGTLRWVDPETGKTGHRTNFLSSPNQIAWGEGVLWLAGGYTGEGTIWRIDLPGDLR